VTRVLRSCSAASIAAARTIFNDCLNVLFPSDCRVCGAPLLALSRAHVCDSCVGRIVPQAGTLCTRCGDALPPESLRFLTLSSAANAGECTLCRLAPPEFTRAVAYAVYDDEVREMLHLLKFNGMHRVAHHVLGEPMAQAILQLEPHAADDLLVIPVPLFAARQRSRGFNQAQLLASAALARLRKLRPAWRLTLEPNNLIRVKDTRSLFALQPQQRRASLRGAFRVAAPERLRGREILLIDDIMTTGATARECARVLRRAGARKVWVATLARAQTRRIALWDAALPSAPQGFG